MKRTIAAIMALTALLLCSCAPKPEPLPPVTEQTESAVDQTEEPAAEETEAQPEEAPQPADAVAAGKAGFEHAPGVTPPSGFDISEFFKSRTDLLAFGADREDYCEKRFGSLCEEYGVKTVAGAFCRVTVKDIKTGFTDEENGGEANSGFKLYKATAELEIEKIEKAAGNVEESRIKEGGTVEVSTVYGFVYEGGGKSAGKTEIALPVPEAGSEYLVFIVDSFGENGYTRAFFITDKSNERDISEKFESFYKDVYPALEDAYNKAKEYLNGFLQGILSDPYTPEKFEEPTFEFRYPAT